MWDIGLMMATKQSLILRCGTHKNRHFVHSKPGKKKIA